MKGIIFTEELFKAILDRRATQTRRTVKDWPIGTSYEFTGRYDDDGNAMLQDYYGNCLDLRPRYRKGETVYLKEPYCFDPWGNLKYKFDFPEEHAMRKKMPWKNKLFMPEKLGRVFIEITGAKLERLKDITEEEILFEGIKPEETDIQFSLFEMFADLWDSINKTPYTWDDNPWVWVYDFEI